MGSQLGWARVRDDSASAETSGEVLNFSSREKVVEIGELCTECGISPHSHRAPLTRGGPRSCRPEMLVLE